MVAASVFDDARSLFHFATAFLSVLLGVDVSATLAFLAYQLVEREPVGRKLGDFVEWVLGLLAGALARTLLRLPC